MRKEVPKFFIYFVLELLVLLVVEHLPHVAHWKQSGWTVTSNTLHINPLKITKMVSNLFVQFLFLLLFSDLFLEAHVRKQNIFI